MLAELSVGDGEGNSLAEGADRLSVILWSVQMPANDRTGVGGVTGSRGKRRNQTGVSGISRVDR